MCPILLPAWRSPCLPQLLFARSSYTIARFNGSIFLPGIIAAVTGASEKVNSMGIMIEGIMMKYASQFGLITLVRL